MFVQNYIFIKLYFLRIVQLMKRQKKRTAPHSTRLIHLAFLIQLPFRIIPLETHIARKKGVAARKTIQIQL